MDFRRAQRNLNLLLIDGNPDNLEFNENDNPDRFSSSPTKSFNDTQIPDFDLSSSDTEMKQPTTTFSQETVEHKQGFQVITVNDDIGTNINEKNEPSNDISNINGSIESTKNKTSKNDSDDNGTTATNNNNNKSGIFLNTQIQSRLDEANEEMEIKSQLNQFKYTQLESHPMSIPPVLKRMNSNTNSQSGIGKKKRKTVSRVSRGTHLMELLSGKNKKVRDIIKNNNKNAKSQSKESSSTKNKTIVYDTYNEKEWNILKRLLLEKFPENTNEDVDEMFKYVYGDSESQLEKNKEQNSVDIWSASQQSLFVSPEISQKPHFPTQENKDEKVKLLSLSQVMEDTSMIDIVQVNDNNDNIVVEEIDESKLTHGNDAISERYSEINDEEKQKLVIDYDNIKEGGDYKDNIIQLGKENIKNILEEKKNSDEDVYNNKEMQNISVSEHMNDKDQVVIYDSMEEEEDILNKIHIENEDMFKRQKTYQNVSENSRLKPTVGLGSIPLLPFDSISPEKGNSIINLTQESFKVTSELVSPIKPISSDSDNTNELLVGNQIQVPATRTATFNSIQEIKEDKSDKHVPDIMLRISTPQLDDIIKTQDYFKIQKAIHMNEMNDIVYDSYDEDNENKMDIIKEDIIVTLVPRSKGGLSSTVIISPLKSTLNGHDITSQETYKDIESEVWDSQSVKDIRLNIRKIGLKTSRKKSEMIESLKLASQILQSQGVSEITPKSQTSKYDMFKYLTLLAKQFPSTILEKFYTYQAIPIDEMIENFNLIDPFVDRIEEQTIKEWAEANGIILCQ